ncbi:MAG: exosortase/archaeosortase family protein [Armatimonadetes bacterium]|nr:exosortase/archaeosortase family protein [Armatimonadota bacterium]
MPDLWLADDGYYSHGFLVPIIAGMIIVRWWPRFKDHEFKTFWPALIPLFFVIAVFRAAYATDIPQIMSLSLLAALFFGVWFAMGGKWAWRMSLPIGYLLFMLPIWTGLIDNYTNPLQRLSTRVAFQMLNVTGFEPHQDSETVIYLNNFVLDVGVPCSGFKLVLAVTAFMIFFVAIARLNVWSNMIMFASVLPICLFINGLRIALIGVVGDYYGREAGMTFHDYSGYITLVVCFFMLFKLARWLGWKD